MVPTSQFQTMLEIQRKEYQNDVMGSTLWRNGKPPISCWEYIKDIIYTDYLRMRMLFHTPCNSCSDMMTRDEI